LSYIQLSREAFNNNASYYTKKLGNINKLCIALKDNAYGHGIKNIAQLSSEFGIKHCLVRNIYEANMIENYNFESILVLYDKSNEKQNNNIIFSTNSIDDLKFFNTSAKIELKIDTGMSRNGIQVHEINEAIKIIKQKNLTLNGVFTHFHSADENNDSYKNQENIFLESIKQINLQINTKFRIHCSNSAGVNKIDNLKYDMARIGIGMYGYNEISQDYLMPVMSLYASLISTRVLNKDDCIGYGASYKIKQDKTLISNYDIGYGDGFFRINENQKAYIQNKKQILGRVSMDSFSVLGDDKKICVFNNASHLAKVHNTIEYEILTHLMPHLKRIII